MEDKNLFSYTKSVSSGTVISRILGYIRDMLIAHIFGAGIIADAFYAAYRVPNLFRRLLGEGAMSASFIPVFTEYIETKTHKETEELLNVIFTAIVVVVSVICFLGIVFASPLMKVIVWGFGKQTEKMYLTITLTRILFPYLFFICLAALMLGVLNSLRKFFIPAVAPALLNLSEIIYVLFIAGMILTKESQIKGLAISVVAGGFGQYFLQQIWVFKNNFKIKLNFNFKHPGLKKIVTLMIPVTIGFSVDQVNAFVDTICGSFLEHGSITALYYSNRLMQLPLALFGISIATVALPIMSSGVAQNNVEKIKKTLNFSIRMVLFLLMPCMFGFISIGFPIVRLLFERGMFDRNASYMTYNALLFYSTGLIAYAVVKIFAGFFYSYKETIIPLRIAVVCMILNAILNVILMGPLKVGGLALATSISSWINAGLLFLFLHKKVGHFGGKKILKVFLKTIFISFLMSLVVCFICSKEELPILFSVSVSMVFAILFYLFFSKVLKMDEYKLFIEFSKDKIDRE